MKCLLYCIIRNQGRPEPEAMTGVGGRPVFLITYGKLAAVVAEVNRSDLAPWSLQVPIYQRVIESFHRDFPAIPVRFGSLFHDRSQVRQQLTIHCDRYDNLLRELEGCVEMGIRILLPQSLSGSAAGRSVEAPSSCFDTSPPSGSNYLMAQKAQYDQNRLSLEVNKPAVAQCLAMLEGLYVKYRVEMPFSGVPSSVSLFGAPMISLYFLVRRESVERFRERFRSIKVDETRKLLLSGPWPPYNFVLPDTVSEITGVRAEKTYGF